MINMNMNIGYTNQVWSSWFNNFPLEKNGDGFFHYTSAENAINILNFHCDKKKTGDSHYLTLWASHFLFLNDSNELKDGLNNLQKAMKKRPENIVPDIAEKLDEYADSLSCFDSPLFANNSPNHFILCFSDNGNLLSQWKYYGKESGVSIEFDLANCVYNGYCSDYNKEYVSRDAFLVDYGRDREKADKFTEILYGANNNDLPNDSHALYGRIMHCMALASFMKDESFRDERERRLLFAPVYYPLNNETPEVLYNKYDYRYSEGRIKPYIKIRIKHKENKTTPEKPPIKSVTIGPGYNQHLIFNAIVKYLLTKYPSVNDNDIVLKLDDERDYKRCKCVSVNRIKVRLSDIPFRD